MSTASSLAPAFDIHRVCLQALRLALGKEPALASSYDKYQSLALAVRAKLMDNWLETERRIQIVAVSR